MFEDYVSFCYVASFLLGVGGIACTWLVPDDYDLGQVRLFLGVFGSACRCVGCRGGCQPTLKPPAKLPQ